MTSLEPRRSTRDGVPMSDLKREIRTFLAENFILDPQAGSLQGDASLTLTGVLDSMGVLELILFLEERFGFKVPDEDTLPENLDTVDRIVAYTHRRLGGGAPPA